MYTYIYIYISLSLYIYIYIYIHIYIYIYMRIQGEAIGPTGWLHFGARLGEERGAWGSSQRVVRVRTTYTKISFCCAVHADGTVEDLRQAIRDVLQWPEEQAVTIERAAVGERQQAAFANEKAALGGLREVVLDCPPHLRLFELPMSVRRARELLGSVSSLSDSEAFARGLRRCSRARGSTGHGALLREQWAAAAGMAPFFGYDASLEGLRAAVRRALWAVREEPDAQVLHGRFAELGFRPRRPPPPKVVRRRRLQRPAADSFLQRNGLGPPSWGACGEGAPEPGSESDSEAEEGTREEEPDSDGEPAATPGASGSRAPASRACAHGAFAAALHPEMIRRTKRREQVTPTCDLELTPVHGYGEGLQLYTKPPCSLYFYSNLRQTWTVRPGHLRPRPAFAIAISCPSGAKRAGRADWTKLRQRLVPMLKQTAFLMMASARAILPRPLSAAAAWEGGAYRSEAGIVVRRPGEGEDDRDAEEEGSEDEAVVMTMARRRAGGAGGAGGGGGGAGGGMFDFDDLEDLDGLEEVADDVRAELRDQRRRRNAVREVWRRDARQQARRSDFLKAACPAGPGGDAPEVAPAALCKQLATAAFKRGDLFSAQLWYSRELERLGEREEERERRAVALSNRSAARAKAGHCEAALDDARQAVSLRPTWGRAWARAGAAAARLALVDEARAAWFSAVEFDPTVPHVEGLAGAHAAGARGSEDASHEGKEKGNQAARGGEWGSAIAHYTVAVATLPPPPKNPKAEDEQALLRAVLLANRYNIIVV